MKTALILFLIALIVRLAAILFWQFDGLYGQDPYAYLTQAGAIIENLPRGLPPPPGFFWPNGYPLLIAGFMIFFGQTAWAGQLAALLSGALLSPLVYVLSRDLWPSRTEQPDGQPVKGEREGAFGRRAGLLAGLVIAVAGQPILSSIVVMADIPALFWATLAAWLSVRVSRQNDSGPATFLLIGLAAALALISRWLYALVLPALGLYLIYSLPRTKKLVWSLGWAALGGLIILAPQLWLSLNKPEGLVHSWLVGWRPGNFFQREFYNVDGHFVYQLPTGIFYAQPAGHPAYIFPLLGLASLWGLWRLWRTKDWGAMILLVGWAAPVYLFLAGIPYQNFRFGLTLYLPLLILAGYGLSDLWARLEAGPHRRFSPLLLKAVIALSLIGMLLWAYPMLDSFLTAQNQAKYIARQVEQQLPEDAALITFGLTLTLQHYTRLNTLELFYLDEADLETLAKSEAPLYLLLDTHNIENQWQDQIPQRNYRWLRTYTTLAEMDVLPPYVLFRVRPPS